MKAKITAGILFKDILNLFIFAIPAVLSISIAQILMMKLYIHNAVYHSQILAFFEPIRLLPAFFYAYISDRHYRKSALILSHVVAISLGSVFFFLKLPMASLISMSLAFCPISVARAALLDNFPKHSSLLLITITYFAAHVPRIFYSYFDIKELDGFLLALISLLALNAILTSAFFKDKKEETEDSSTSRYLVAKDKKILTLLLISGFLLSHSSMEMVWALIHHSIKLKTWMDLTNWGFILGLIGAIFYKKTPHMSLITITYMTGLGISILTLIGKSYGVFACEGGLFSSMTYYAILSGIYWPLVTDATISMFNPKRKATASIFIELASAISVVLAYFLVDFTHQNTCFILYLIGALFFIATFLQRKVETSRGRLQNNF